MRTGLESWLGFKRGYVEVMHTERESRAKANMAAELASLRTR